MGNEPTNADVALLEGKRQTYPSPQPISQRLPIKSEQQNRNSTGAQYEHKVAA